MGYMTVFGDCVSCRKMFTYNPNRVPSIRVRFENGKAIPDPNGKREPVCKDCIEEGNRRRVAAGLEPHRIDPEAYEPEEVD